MNPPRVIGGIGTNKELTKNQQRTKTAPGGIVKQPAPFLFQPPRLNMEAPARPFWPVLLALLLGVSSGFSLKI